MLPTYIEPVFRPPSEGRSLILQVTNGCSWNQCSFCDMYTQPQKKFRAKKPDEIEQEIKKAAQVGPRFSKVFLADGDAFVLPTKRLLSILHLIRQHMPWVERVGAYCLPSNLKKKSVDDLVELKQAGLGIAYVGAESGDDTVLAAINKGETFESSKLALQKLKQAEIKTSVMVLNGMGGNAYSQQHAINSARLMNECQPDYLSTLIVSFPLGLERVEQGYSEHNLDKFELPNQHQLFVELHQFIAELDLTSTVFRSDHASNYLPLKGVLGQDKSELLSQLEVAINRPNSIPLRQEWQRGL